MKSLPYRVSCVVTAYFSSFLNALRMVIGNEVNNPHLHSDTEWLSVEDIRAADEMGNVFLYDFSVPYHPTMEYGTLPVTELSMSP
ncbi:hypothetical protein BZA77DRAFT_355776 [Pyronema omphalodes]|nr:hypothetical protein BZA77DRAFT_355776 [Pyronema omphalodes]